MTDTAAEAVVREYIEAGFGQGDAAVLDRVLSDALVNHDKLAHTDSDKAAIIDLVNSLRTTFVNLRVVIRELHSQGDIVRSRTTVSGIAVRPFRGEAPTGKPTHFEIEGTFRVENGQIVERWG